MTKEADSVLKPETPERVKLVPLTSTWTCPNCKTQNTVQAHELAEHGPVVDSCFNCGHWVTLGLPRTVSPNQLNPLANAVEAAATLVDEWVIQLRNIGSHATAAGAQVLASEIRALALQPANIAESTQPTKGITNAKIQQVLEYCERVTPGDWGAWKVDAEFIANVRTDLPAFATALLEARREIERLTDSNCVLWESVNSLSTQALMIGSDLQVEAGEVERLRARVAELEAENRRLAGNVDSDPDPEGEHYDRSHWQ